MVDLYLHLGFSGMDEGQDDSLLTHPADDQALNGTNSLLQFYVFHAPTSKYPGHILLQFFAPLAEGQRAIVMALCP